MSYDPTTDFLALLRQSSGAELARMPGLDYVVDALARAGLFRLSVGQTAPTSNQATTVWLQPANPSWTAEGTVFLWDTFTSQYALATPELWTSLLTNSVSGYRFQSAAALTNTVEAKTSLLVVQRAAPVATALTLPTVASRSGRALQIADWSTGVAGHAITLNPTGGATIMRQLSWNMFSTADQLAGLTLQPAAELNGWIIAP